MLSTPTPREEQPAFGLPDKSKARALIGQLFFYYSVIGHYIPTNKHANRDFTGCSLKIVLKIILLSVKFTVETVDGRNKFTLAQ